MGYLIEGIENESRGVEKYECIPFE